MIISFPYSFDLEEKISSSILFPITKFRCTNATLMLQIALRLADSMISETSLFKSPTVIIGPRSKERKDCRLTESKMFGILQASLTSSKLSYKTTMNGRLFAFLALEKKRKASSDFLSEQTFFLRGNVTFMLLISFGSTRKKSSIHWLSSVLRATAARKNIRYRIQNCFTAKGSINSWFLVHYLLAFLGYSLFISAFTRPTNPQLASLEVTRRHGKILASVRQKCLERYQC